MAKSKVSSKNGKKRHTIELSAKAAFFWGICLFFLLAWIFALGIFVGRGLVPDSVQGISELKEQIARLQGSIGNSDSARPETVQRPFEDPKLAFYENLSLKKNKVARRMLHHQEKRKVNRPAILKEKGPKKDTSRENKAARKGGRYTIQVASLATQGRAKGLVKKLMAKGYPVYYYKVKVKGRPRYRVRCGRFRTTQEAERFARKFFKDVKIKGLVLRVEK